MVASTSSWRRQGISLVVPARWSSPILEILLLRLAAQLPLLAGTIQRRRLEEGVSSIQLERRSNATRAFLSSREDPTRGLAEPRLGRLFQEEGVPTTEFFLQQPDLASDGTPLVGRHKRENLAAQRTEKTLLCRLRQGTHCCFRCLDSSLLWRLLWRMGIGQREATWGGQSAQERHAAQSSAAR